LDKALSRIAVNEKLLDEELEKHYELLAEPVQTVMRKYDIPNPYEKLKDFTRGKANVNRKDFLEFIDKLDGLPEFEKKMLKELTPSRYVGYAPRLAKDILKF
jgi:adenylosuccinate lyase